MSPFLRKCGGSLRRGCRWALYLGVRLILLFGLAFLATILIMLAFVAVCIRLQLQPSEIIKEWAIVVAFTGSLACCIHIENRTDFAHRLAKRVSRLTEDNFAQTGPVKRDGSKP